MKENFITLGDAINQTLGSYNINVKIEHGDAKVITMNGIKMLSLDLATTTENSEKISIKTYVAYDQNKPLTVPTELETDAAAIMHFIKNSKENNCCPNPCALLHMDKPEDISKFSSMDRLYKRWLDYTDRAILDVLYNRGKYRELTNKQIRNILKEMSIELDTNNAWNRLNSLYNRKFVEKLGHSYRYTYKLTDPAIYYLDVKNGRSVVNYNKVKETV